MFLSWLEYFNFKLNLIAHNSQAFDMRHLLHSVQSTGSVQRFSSIVYGIGDTLPFFKKFLPEEKSYSQSNLYQKYFPEKTYDQHNASADITALKSILHQFDSNKLDDFTWTLTSVIEDVKWMDGMNARLPSFSPLYSSQTSADMMHESHVLSVKKCQDLAWSMPI